MAGTHTNRQIIVSSLRKNSLILLLTIVIGFVGYFSKFLDLGSIKVYGLVMIALFFILVVKDLQVKNN